MISEHYHRVIREWCEATGMEAWDEREDMHVEINDTLVGLIPGGENEPDALHIYLDLGHHDLPDLYASLLEANVSIDADDQGCFGLHPLTQSVVYRTKRQLGSDTDGSQLPTALDALIRSARSRLGSALTH